MKRCWLALALLAQEPADTTVPEEARALLIDVQAWTRTGDLPEPDELGELRVLAEELLSSGGPAAGSELRELLRALGSLGHALKQAGRGAEGSAWVLWAGERAEVCGDLATRAWALDWLGQEAWVRGELDRAAEWLALAAEADGRRGALAEVARDLADVARVRSTQGRLDESREAALRAWQVAKESGSLSAERSAGEILAGIWFDLGRHRQALELCLELLAASGPGEASDEPQVRLEILAANLLADVGRLEAAAAHARTAHELALDARIMRQAPLLHLEAKLSLGLLLGDLGQTDEALALLDAATAEFERLGDARGRGWAAKNRGFVLFAAGRRAESRPSFAQAWRLGAELRVPFLEAIGALGVAEAVLLAEARPVGAERARAEEALQTAERVSTALRDRALQWRCAALRGRILLDDGRLADALAELERAVRGIERWRLRLGASGLVEHALRQRSDPYRDAAFAAAKLGRMEVALTHAALLQARVLDELRARRNGPLPMTSTPAIDELRERVARLAACGADANDGELERAEDELDAALADHELWAGARLSPSPDPLDVAALAQGLTGHALDLVLVYLVGPEETLVLRLEGNGPAEVQGRLLPVGQAQLEAWIRAVREPFERLEAGEIDLVHLSFDAAAARSLHAALVEPLALPADARIALVLDRVLAALPFELLVAGGTAHPLDFAQPFAHLASLEYFGDQYELVVLGSMARLREPLPARAGQSLVLVAPDPVGPTGSADEARVVALARGGVRIVADARAADVASLATGATLLHFAAHGGFDPGRPAHGHLLLGGALPGTSAKLESWQLAELDLEGAEIVLSACHSGRGAWRAGAGLAGLLRGFFLAGAREVIASHWAVESRVTARFMELYHGARAQGHAAPAALRRARASLRAEVDPRGFSLAHPAFWAAWSVHR